MLDASILDFMIKSVLGVFLGYIINEIFKFKEKIRDLETKLDTVLAKIDGANNNNDLCKIKEYLIELKGMIHVLTCYQKIIKPPSGGHT